MLQGQKHDIQGIVGDLVSKYLLDRPEEFTPTTPLCSVEMHMYSIV